jgi:hypothetical protein
MPVALDFFEDNEYSLERLHRRFNPSDQRFIEAVHSDAHAYGRARVESNEMPPFAADIVVYFNRAVNQVDADFTVVANEYRLKYEKLHGKVLPDIVEIKEAAANEFDREQKQDHFDILDNINIEKFDRKAFELKENIQRAEILGPMDASLTDCTKHLSECRPGKPTISTQSKWFVMFFFALAETVGTYAWVKELVAMKANATITNDLIENGQQFMAFSITFGQLMIAEKAGEDVRQRHYWQMAWKIVVLTLISVAVSYYRETVLRQKGVTDFDFGKAAIAFSVQATFVALSVVLGYYSSYADGNFVELTSRKQMLETQRNGVIQQINTIHEEMKSAETSWNEQRQERMKAQQEAYQQQKQRHIDNAVIEFQMVYGDLEKIETAFHSEYARVRSTLNTIISLYSTATAEYKRHFNAGPDCPDVAFPELVIPNRVNKDIGRLGDFVGASR